MNWEIHQIIVKVVLLNGVLEVENNMDQPDIGEEQCILTNINYYIIE